jgi:hypothetical protein
MSAVAVIGRVADTDAARAWPGHDVLPARGWTPARNLAFMRAIVAAQRPVYVASPICRANLVDARGELTIFCRELVLLEHAGYQRVGDWLLPPDPFWRALAARPVAFYHELRARAGDGDRRIPELAPLVRQLALLQPRLADDARAILAAGVPYGEALRLAHRFAMTADDEARARTPDLGRVYGPKAGAELEPLIALFPDVIAFPTLAALDVGRLIATRVVPVHPLGLVLAPLYSDGMVMSPREYFLHDVDHARFMVREELLSRGVDLPDAYQSRDGGAPTTLIDARHNRHRTILDGAAPKVAAARLGDRARLDARARFAATLDQARAQLPPEDAAAVTLLLFEIVHEKGFPLDATVLRRELAGAHHPAKLRRKLDGDFYGVALRPGAATVARLDWARGWLEARA